MGKMFFLCLALAAIGLALTVAGFANTDPDNPLGFFRWAGPALLGAGVLLMALYVFFFRS